MIRAHEATNRTAEELERKNKLKQHKGKEGGGGTCTAKTGKKVKAGTGVIDETSIKKNKLSSIPSTRRDTKEEEVSVAESDEEDEDSGDDVCEICGFDEIDPGDDDEASNGGTALICDGCDMSFHLFCLGECSFLVAAPHPYPVLCIRMMMSWCHYNVMSDSAGLREVPEGNWYCELCCRNFGIYSYGHSAMSSVSRARQINP